MIKKLYTVCWCISARNQQKSNEITAKVTLTMFLDNMADLISLNLFNNRQADLWSGVPTSNGF